MTENKKAKFIAKRIKKTTQLVRRLENLKSVKPFSLGEWWIHMNKIVRLCTQLSITAHEIKDLKVKPKQKQFEPGGILPRLQQELSQIPSIKKREGTG